MSETMLATSMMLALHRTLSSLGPRFTLGYVTITYMLVNFNGNNDKVKDKSTPFMNIM